MIEDGVFYVAYVAIFCASYVRHIDQLVVYCNFLSNFAGLTSFLLNVTPDAKVKAQPLKEWHAAQQDGGKVRKLKFICL